MDDKSLMQDLLLEAKGVCDLYMHGTIESATPDVHGTFGCALDESLKMQDDIYKKMMAQGWYPAENAEPSKIRKVKDKFCCG
ncbi:MAG: spore coat protein [Firmicutes bacterium]|nr:spore coat protein [Bacillota bacterium]MCD7783202.1 spore coat protein [Bacillota bacterium]MCD7787445.1 spore coat protein [Bacillota bacterium]MCD8314647.1 spore coat protein [Bacillota bacterium]